MSETCYYHQDITRCLRGENEASSACVSQEYLQPYIDDSIQAIKNILSDLEQGSLPMLNPAVDDQQLDAWQSQVVSKWQKFTDVVVLGTGGSSLGAQTLVALNQSAYRTKPGCPRLHFLDNLDPATYLDCMASLNLSATGFLVISQSGTTPETLNQCVLTLDMLRQNKVANWQNQFLIITQTDPQSPLLTLAQRHSIQVLPHPSNIGGRFSAFTVVGLLPALLAGVDIKRVCQGAVAVIDALGKRSAPVLGAALHCALAARGANQVVLLPYADQLVPFSHWFRQLWAESLGKQGKGTTPIQALGPVDQHSQLQLYLDGPRDKFFNVISIGNYKDTEIVSRETLRGLAVDYLAGHTMGQLRQAESLAAIETLANHGCPVRHFHLTELNEESLGALMMHCFVETILVARIWQIDAFNQPAVEDSKRLTRSYLLEGKMQ